MRKVTCPAGQRVALLRPVMGGGGRDVVFRAEARDGGPVAGRIEERRRGLMGTRSRFHPLEAENRFRIGPFTTGYALFAIAERDTEVAFLTGHTDRGTVLRWVGIGFAALFGLPLLIGLAMQVLGAG